MTLRSPRFVSFALVFTLLAALAPPRARAQEPAAQFGEEVEVSEALLDVLVTDRQGNVVLGLGPGDFRVTLDGRPADVTGATFYSNRRFLESANAAALGIDPRAVPDRRLFVIFVDDQKFATFEARGLLQRQFDAGRALARWLRSELLPSDLVAVVSFDVALRLQADFTSDLPALEAAVDRAVHGEEAPGNWPSRQSGEDAAPSLATHLPQGEALGRETGEIHKALTVLGEALEPVAGRKNLILFTIGFGDVDASGVYQPDPRYHDRMIEQLNAANVAVYPVDLVRPDAEHALEGSFTELARATGGEAFFRVIGFAQPLDRIARETNGYYLVSVRTGRGTGGGYRKVEVEAVNPEFRVRARGGLELRVAEAAPSGG
jgi:VWFA-related protein